MELPLRERLALILREFRSRAPYRNDIEARAALEAIICHIEDRHSGVRADPDAVNATMPDGRIYAPHDDHERLSQTTSVRKFAQRKHMTEFGKNGSVRITRKSGEIELDEPGQDGRTVGELLEGAEHESN